MQDAIVPVNTMMETTTTAPYTLTDSLVSGISQSFREIGFGVADFLPKFIVVMALLILGWAAGALLARVVSQVMKSIKFDAVLQSVGVGEVLSRAGFTLNSGGFVGALVKWFVVVVFLVASLDIFGLSQVNVFLKDVVLGYLPQVIVAVMILLISAVVADAMQKVVVGSTKAAGVPSSHFLGSVTKWSIWIFAALIALSQLGIAPQFMYTLFTGVVAMLALAGGLALGLGGKDIARDSLEHLRKDLKSDR